jgi:hypothetical protein
MADNDNTGALLKSNATWAADFSEANPNFFPDSAKNHQTPHVRPSFYIIFTTSLFFRLFG